MAPTSLSAGCQSLPPLPTVKLGPSGSDSQVGELVHALRPLSVSPTNSPVRLGVSPTATSTPTGVFNQGFEALFPPRWSPGLHSLFRSPTVPPGLSMHECGATGSASHHLVASASLQPGLPCSTIRHLLGSASRCLSVSCLCLAARLRPSYRSG